MTVKSQWQGVMDRKFGLSPRRARLLERLKASPRFQREYMYPNWRGSKITVWVVIDSRGNLAWVGRNHHMAWVVRESCGGRVYEREMEI